MKIAVIGYSGSGKSTLSKELGKHYQAEVLHLDSVHFLPGWEERRREEEQQIAADFLDAHDAWVIDGNYTKLSYDRRMEEADLIIQMLFNRFACLRRARKRYQKYRGQTRPDMAEGCNEKLDGAFVAWILWKGRRSTQRKRYAGLRKQYGDKVVVLKNQKQTDAFLQGILQGGDGKC